MKIYRVEKDGKGPYRVYGLSQHKYELHQSTHGRPGIYDDTLLSQKIPNDFNRYYFGFTSKKSLRKWFKPFNDWLTEKEFTISIYTGVPSIIVRGSTQCIFVKDNATLVSTIPVKDWRW